MQINAETSFNNHSVRHANDMITGDVGIVITDDEDEYVGVVVIKCLIGTVLMISGSYAGQTLLGNCYVRLLATGESVTLTAADDEVPF